jgi:hypothetical protein
MALFGGLGATARGFSLSFLLGGVARTSSTTPLMASSGALLLS